MANNNDSVSASTPIVLMVVPPSDYRFIKGHRNITMVDPYTGRRTHRLGKVALECRELVELVRWIPGTCGTRQFAKVRKSNGTECVLSSAYLRNV